MTTTPEFMQPALQAIKSFGEAGEWLGFAAYTLTGFVLGWIIKRWFSVYLKAHFIKMDSFLGEEILHAIGVPLSILIFNYFFLLAFDQFHKMPPSIWQRVHEIYPLLNIVAIFLLAIRSVDIGVKLFRRRFAAAEGSLDESWCRLVAVLGKTLVSSFGLLFALQIMGVPILPLLTGASFVGAGFALAMQSTIANMIGSFEIMMDRLFMEGDRISFGEYDGFVTKMGLRSIQLTALSGEKINLPNKDLVDKQIRNFSRKGKVCTIFNVGLTYGHTKPQIEQAMSLLKEIVAAHPSVSGDAAVYLRNLGSYTLDLQVICWAKYKNGVEFSSMISDFNLAIKERFDSARLDFAFPTSTVYLKGSLPFPASPV